MVHVPARFEISLGIVNPPSHLPNFIEAYFLVLFTSNYFHSPNCVLWLPCFLELYKHDHQSCLFIRHPDSEIIFLLMFSSQYLYLFRREKNLELYIFILLYREKKMVS